MPPTTDPTELHRQAAEARLTAQAAWELARQATRLATFAETRDLPTSGSAETANLAIETCTAAWETAERAQAAAVEASQAACLTRSSRPVELALSAAARRAAEATENPGGNFDDAEEGCRLAARACRYAARAHAQAAPFQLRRRW